MRRSSGISVRTVPLRPSPGSRSAPTAFGSRRRATTGPRPCGTSSPASEPRGAHGGAVGGVAFGPHGDTLATAGGDGLVRVWNPSNGVKLAELKHGGPVHGVAFDPSGGTLASASHDRTARVWHPMSGSELVRLPHDGRVWAVAFSLDGSRLATASHDRQAVVGRRPLPVPAGSAALRPAPSQMALPARRGAGEPLLTSVELGRVSQCL
jgi:WD40 repeat protein